MNSATMKWFLAMVDLSLYELQFPELRYKQGWIHFSISASMCWTSSVIELRKTADRLIEQ